MSKMFDELKCKWIIKKSSPSFFKAFSRIQDKNKRNAVFAVYAFCRKADDLIDYENDLDALEKFEENLAALKNSNNATSFLWRSLRRVFEKYEMDYMPFLEMIKGQRMDYKKKSYADFPELLEYCYLVASTVGFMILPILSPENHHELKILAINLGYAMQITKILRDVGEDYRNNKVYIPKDLLLKYGYKIETQKTDQNFILLWEDLAKKAEEYYDDSLKSIGKIEEGSRNAVYLSILFYKGILQACRDNDYDVFTKKNDVTKQLKDKIISELLK